MFLIDSTLKHHPCNFTRFEQLHKLVLSLNNFGIEYIELNNFDQYFLLSQSLLQFKMKFIINIQNNKNDIEKIIKCNIHCVKLNLDTCDLDNMTQIVDNLNYIKQKRQGIEIILCVNDIFEINQNILCKLFLATEDYINRICIVDNTGNITHYQMEEMIFFIKNSTSVDIDMECYLYNNTFSAVYNSYIALLNGCNYIYTSIYNQSNITTLSSLISRINYSKLKSCLLKYNLHVLGKLNWGNLVGGKVSVVSVVSVSDLTKFLQINLPKVYNTLNYDYIEKLTMCVNDDISHNPTIYKLLNEDLNFSINYILKYTR